jgi:opacity protein-like surface antigen
MELGLRFLGEGRRGVYIMKKLLIAAGILALSAGMGSAADMRMPVKAKPLVAPPYSWSGFYIGGNAGYGWGEAKPMARSRARKM